MGYIVSGCPCCGVSTPCCGDTVSSVLYAYVTNACGTYLIRLFYDPTISPGKCWSGQSDEILCPFPPPGCDVNKSLKLIFCCQNDGLWLISVQCPPDTGVVTAAINVQCDPFQATNNSLSVCFDCIDSLLITE